MILPQHQEKGIQYAIDRLKEMEDKKIQKLKATRIGTNKFNDTNYKNSDILIIKKEKKTDPEIIKFSKQIITQIQI